MHVISVATQNIWGFHGGWPARRPVLHDGLRDFDLVALQEAFEDQPADLAAGREIAHDAGKGVAVLSRWPIRAVHALESDTLVCEIDASVGRVVFANHAASYQLDRELAREREAVAVARFVDGLGGDHVVLAGDFNARPQSSSMRFLRGLQSLDGMSVCFADAWEAVHGAEPGHTFTPENPTMPTGEGGKWRLDPGRRIDYVLVGCGEAGPTLEARGCSRLFDSAVGGVWASDHFGVGAELGTP